MRIPFISMVAAGALALGGCAYGDLGGLGVGLGYGDPYYGYGYGSPYYGGGYGSPYYGAGYGMGYGYGGYGSPYFGWYDNYYYPGTGYYVYDVNRRAYPMNSTQRRYWSTRSPALATGGTTTTTRPVQPNWSSFSQRAAERQQARQQDRATWRSERATARDDRRTTREERRRDRRNDD